MNGELTPWAVLAYASHDILFPGRWLEVRIGGGSAFPESVQNAQRFATEQDALRELGCRCNAMADIIIRAAQGGHVNAAAEFCELLWPYWHFHGYIDVVIRTHGVVLRTAATGHVSRSRLARLQAQLSVTYRNIGSLSSARGCVDLAVDLARGALPQVEATAFEADGDVSLARGEPARAEACFADAESLVQCVDSRASLIAKRKRASALLGLPDANLNQVESLLKEAWSMCPPGERYNLARLHTEFGRLWGRHGDLLGSCGQFGKAIHIHHVDGCVSRVADNLRLRAEVMCTSASADFKNAAGFYRGIGMNEKEKSAQRCMDILASVN